MGRRPTQAGSRQGRGLDRGVGAATTRVWRGAHSDGGGCKAARRGRAGKGMGRRAPHGPRVSEAHRRRRGWRTARNRRRDGDGRRQAGELRRGA